MDRCRPLVAAALAALAAGVLAPLPVTAAPSRPDSPEIDAWVRPVDGPVVAPFRPGTARFGIGGHAGVDFRAAVGTPVRAAGAGRVSFAGPVAGERFVVVRHGTRLRTTYGYLATIDVARGDEVEAGTRVGTVGGGGSHPRGTLHFGLRDGHAYLDPLLLFAPHDLTEVVRLVPADEGGAPLPPVGAERAALLAELTESGALPAWVTDGGRVGRASAHLARRVSSAAGWFLRETGRVAVESARLAGRVFDEARSRIAAALRMLAPVLDEGLDRALRHGPDVLAAYVLHQLRWGIRIGVAALASGALGPVAAYRLGVVTQETAWEVARGVRDWWRLRRRCSLGPPPAVPPGGRPGRLVAVGGVNGVAASQGEASFALPVTALGYRPGDVSWFSYSPDGSPERADTWAGALVAAEGLAEHLRDHARRHPGRTVDLVGYSLGGLVVEAFLKLHYRGHEGEFPPLGAVVTVAAPHRGSALAGEIVAGARLPVVGDVLDDLADALDQPGPSEQTVQDVAPGSDLLRELAALPFPPGVRVTTVGAVGDWLVTADATKAAGADHVVVDPEGVNDHRNVLSSPRSLDAMARALSGLPPACRGPATTVRNRVQPSLIRAAIEHAEVVVAGARATVRVGRDALGALRSVR